MALNGLFCADVPLKNYSLTQILLFLIDLRWRRSKNTALQRARDFILHIVFFTPRALRS